LEGVFPPLFWGIISGQIEGEFFNFLIFLIFKKNFNFSLFSPVNNRGKKKIFNEEMRILERDERVEGSNFISGQILSLFS